MWDVTLGQRHHNWACSIIAVSLIRDVYVTTSYARLQTVESLLWPYHHLVWLCIAEPYLNILHHRSGFETLIDFGRSVPIPLTAPSVQMAVVVELERPGWLVAKHKSQEDPNFKRSVIDIFINTYFISGMTSLAKWIRARSTIIFILFPFKAMAWAPRAQSKTSFGDALSTTVLVVKKTCEIQQIIHYSKATYLWVSYWHGHCMAAIRPLPLPASACHFGKDFLKQEFIIAVLQQAYVFDQLTTTSKCPTSEIQANLLECEEFTLRSWFEIAIYVCHRPSNYINMTICVFQKYSFINLYSSAYM